MKHSKYFVVSFLAVAACPLWAGYAPTATEINLGQFPIDDYFSTNGAMLPSCYSGYTIQQCVKYFFNNNSSSQPYTPNNYVGQGVVGVRFFFSVDGGYSGSTPWDSYGNVNSQWVTNLQQFLTDLKSYGIQYVTPTPVLMDGNQWGYTYIQPSPPITNCNGSGNLVFLRWMPFGFDSTDGYFPDCQGFNDAYNSAIANPDFWGWSPFFNLAGSVFGAIRNSGLQMREFDVDQERDVANFTVTGRLIYDNKDSTDVLGTLRSLASSSGLNPYSVTFSTAAEQSSVSGFSCGSVYGDSALIFKESELIAAYAGGWSRIGNPNGSNTVNNLTCQGDPTGMISLPVTYSQPTVTDVHAYPCVYHPSPGTTCDQNQDTTSSALTMYTDLWAFLQYRNFTTTNVMMIGETQPGQSCDGVTAVMATQNVNGYEQSTLYQALTNGYIPNGVVMRPWTNIEVVPPPYGSGVACFVVPGTINPPY
jgi:hypothetical protein